MADIRIIGAGLAGLSAAVALAGRGGAVRLDEAAPQAGGRCRSYFDPQLGQVIDNGNHFVFSGNQAARRYLKVIGAEDRLKGPDKAEFVFHDLAEGSRWTMRLGDGRIPWWVFDPKRRAAGTTLAEHLPLAALALRGRGPATLGSVIRDRGRFWQRVVDPMMLAVLNCPPEEGSAWLAARFMRESFLRGGRACRTMAPTPTLGAAFIDPALAWLEKRGVTARFGTRLRRLVFSGDMVTGLDFGGAVEPVSGPVILAVPPWVAAELVPELIVPDRHCAILNAHFAAAPPPAAPMITALIGGCAQWVVCHEARISTTISGADAVIDEDRAILAERIWADICAALGLKGAMPNWQIVKEKRATFAATPDQDAKRPAAATRWRNLFLAGDWTQTRLPATIEGALRSGETAARLALRK